MEFIFFVIGLVIGFIAAKLLKPKEKTCGIIGIDPVTGLCRIRVTNDILSNNKTKKAIFDVDHNAVVEDEEDYSREEQTL